METVWVSCEEIDGAGRGCENILRGGNARRACGEGTIVEGRRGCGEGRRGGSAGKGCEEVVRGRGGRCREGVEGAGRGCGERVGGCEKEVGVRGKDDRCGGIMSWG